MSRARNAAIAHALACQKAAADGTERPAYKGPPLIGCDLSDLDLSFIVLRGHDLRGVDFSWSAMMSADLTGAYCAASRLFFDVNAEHRTIFNGTDLRDADLSRTDLRGASLRCADLMRAKMVDTDLSGADLRGADITDADLTGARTGGADMRCVSSVATDTAARTTAHDIPVLVVPSLPPDSWAFVTDRQLNNIMEDK